MKLVIVIVTILGLTAVIGAVIVGTGSFDGTVVDKPYDRGLLWDWEQNERIASGWSIEMISKTFTVGRNSLSFRVLDREKMPIKDAEVMVKISRPSTNVYDREYRDIKPKKTYKVALDLPLYGYWDLGITVSHNGKINSFEHKIFAEK